MTLEDLPDPEPSAEELAIMHERSDLVCAAVRRLPEAYRRTVALRYFLGIPAVEIARDEGIPILAERVALQEFRRASEIFLASTGHEVCPVIRLDGASVGSGRAGPLTLQLQKGFRARVAAGDDEPR